MNSWLSSRNILKFTLFLILSYFSYLMVLITLQYLPIHLDVAFLRIKQDVVQLWYYPSAFFLHVFSSIFVLFTGMTQFSNRIRVNYPTVHRFMGKTYVFLILLAAAPSGWIIGYHANGGIFAQIGFMLLAILWFFFTFQAFRYAKKRNFEKHRKFMMRSFALTLSAITLRLLKFGIAHLWELPPMDITRIIAWGGWIVNLGLVELSLIRQRSANL